MILCFSDHDFVDLHFNFNDSACHGPGLWKCNTSLLTDNEFCSLISERIESLIDCIDLFGSVKTWWDFLKSSLKAEVIAFSRGRRKTLSRERVLIINQLINLKQRLIQGEQELSAEIDALESRLKALIIKDLEGVKIRSRARWIEEGERPTRFFFKLEGERKVKHAVSSIFDTNGCEVFSREEIECAHVEFYTSLFSPENIDDNYKCDLLNTIDRMLSQVDCDFCEGAISLEELTNAMSSLNLNKSPGPNGFPVEFYKHFWSLLGPPFLRVVNECFASNSLCDSMKGSATRLLFKKRGDRKDLKNWRPISLLNVDYKIISKVLTSCLAGVLDTIVDPDQTCSVPGRSVVSNIFLLRDVLDYIERTGETAILVSLDQEKAFDRVNRGFLMDVLERYGFGNNFRRWVSTLYSGAYMRILINNHLSKEIPLRRGVRQGDPLSPLLYVLCVEVLANLIRRSDEVKGFLLPGAQGKYTKVRQYADDTTTILKDFHSLVSLFDLIAVYEKGSGAKLNRSKTEAMWLGAWKERQDQPLGLTWVRKMKILGIIFGTESTEIDNWQPKINKLEKALNLWKSRSLSFIGRGLIINVIGLSKCFYLARILVVPTWVLARVTRLIWLFLWGTRIETVSWRTCCLPLKCGGLGVCSLDLKCRALRLASTLFIINSPADASFFLCRYFIGRRISLMHNRWKCLRDIRAPSASMPTRFYKDVLSTLTDVLTSCDDFVSRKIYAALLMKDSTSPILPYQWSTFLGMGFSLDDHWPLVRDKFTENFKNDILWLIVLRGVKVRDSLARWEYIDSARCASCPRRETIDHCFINCPRVKRTWEHFVPLLSSLLGSAFVVNLLFIFFFRWPSTEKRRARLSIYLVKSILYGIWTFRNKATFHNGREDHRAVIRYISNDIRQWVLIDFSRLAESQFSDFWCFPGFCTVEDESFNILV